MDNKDNKEKIIQEIVVELNAEMTEFSVFILKYIKALKQEIEKN